MLSLFPDFIYLGVAFSPLVIRLCVAVALIGLARHHLRHKDSLAKLVSEFAPWLSPHASLAARLSPAITIAVAVCLFLGLFTQGAAVLAAIAAVKVIYFKKKYPDIAPESRSFYVLVLVLSLLLVFAGAGPFAFDLPL